jgi:hypothetical protein
MQSSKLKPKGIRFLARSYVAAGLFILLVNLILPLVLSPLVSLILGSDEVSTISPFMSKFSEMRDEMLSLPNGYQETDSHGSLNPAFYQLILIGIGFTYIILGIALSRAKSWSVKIFSSLTIIFAVLAVFVGDLSLYVFEIGFNAMGMREFYTIFNNFIMVGAVLYPVIVDRYLHSSNIEAYFNSKAVTPTAVADYTHRSPF